MVVVPHRAALGAAVPVVPVGTAAAGIALVQPTVPLALVGTTAHLSVVRIGNVISSGGPCPHMTAIFDRSNQPLRARDTGLVILGETH